MDDLIKRIESLADPEPDSEWKFGKNFGIMLAVQEIQKGEKEHEAGEATEHI